MAQAVEVRGVSLDEYAAVNKAPGAEVINGEIFLMTAQGRGHSYLVENLQTPLANYVRRHKLGKVVSEATFILDGNPRTKWVRGSRLPDLAFIARERVLAHNAEYTDPEEPWWLAPDIAAEIISHTDSYDYLSGKVADYLTHGVRLVWMIDPRQRTIRVHTPDQPTGFTLREGDILTAEPVIAGWKMKVAEVFAED